MKNHLRTFTLLAAMTALFLGVGYVIGGATAHVSAYSGDIILNTASASPGTQAVQAVTLAADAPLDLLALAVLPGVAGIEEDRHAPGKVTVLAMPGHSIFPSINALITHRGWNITSMNLEPGRLNDVVHHLSQEVTP